MKYFLVALIGSMMYVACDKSTNQQQPVNAVISTSTAVVEVVTAKKECDSQGICVEVPAELSTSTGM